jgi:uncharacterized RDD family membrane protein YckC
VPRAKPEQVVVKFDPEELKAPFLLRCGAFLIDYILIISIPVLSLLIGRMIGNDGIKLLNSEVSNTGWMVAVLLGLTNFVIFPMFSGQSLGKMLTGLKIVRRDGTTPTFWALLLRHTLGYLLTGLTVGLGFLLAAFNNKGKSLHDYVAGTLVIYGRKRIVKETIE